MGAFVPPPLSSHEGPAGGGGFVPPSLDSHEGPAPAPSYFGTLWRDLKATPGAIADAVQHPVKAFEGISDALEGERDKAVDLFKSGKYSEAFGGGCR